MRLGIYGGTFNPPHAGHVKAAAAAAEQLRLDILLIVPAGIPPHKALPDETPPAEDRMELVRRSFGTISGVEFTDMELKKEDVSYTVETYRRTEEKIPCCECLPCHGLDMFLALETWKEAPGS